MYDFSKLTEEEKDTCVSGLNAVWHACLDKLQDSNLGDVERKNTEEYRDEVRRIMKKVGVQFG